LGIWEFGNVLKVGCILIIIYLYHEKCIAIILIANHERTEDVG